MSAKREKKARKIEKEKLIGRITRRTMEPRIVAAVHGANKKEAFDALINLILYVENIPDEHEGPVIKAILDRDLKGEGR